MRAANTRSASRRARGSSRSGRSRAAAERAERAAAGIVDYPGQEAANAAEGAMPVDMFRGAGYDGEGERMDEEFMPGYAQGED